MHLQQIGGCCKVSLFGARDRAEPPFIDNRGKAGDMPVSEVEVLFGDTWLTQLGIRKDEALDWLSSSVTWPQSSCSKFRNFKQLRISDYGSLEDFDIQIAEDCPISIYLSDPERVHTTV